MSERQLKPEDPYTLGQDTVLSLRDMNIDPLPASYTVWFHHMNCSNSQLSTDIEREKRKGNSIDVELSLIHI